MITDFERKDDSVEADGTNSLSNLADWEASNPTYTLKVLNDQLCGAAHFCFDREKMFLYGLVFQGLNLKQNGLIMGSKNN